MEQTLEEKLADLQEKFELASTIKSPGNWLASFIISLFEVSQLDISDNKDPVNSMLVVISV